MFFFNYRLNFYDFWARLDIMNQTTCLIDTAEQCLQDPFFSKLSPQWPCSKETRVCNRNKPNGSSCYWSKGQNSLQVSYLTKEGGTPPNERPDLHCAMFLPLLLFTINVSSTNEVTNLSFRFIVATLTLIADWQCTLHIEIWSLINHILTWNIYILFSMT